MDSADAATGMDTAKLIRLPPDSWREVVSSSLVVRECRETEAQAAKRKARKMPVPVVSYTVVIVR